MSDNNQNSIDERIKFFNNMFENAEPMKTTAGTSRTEKFFVKDDNDEKDLFVYLMNHDDFLYNVDNTRIIASREKWEADNNTLLDPMVNKEEIEEFLQKNPSYGDKTTEELREDIRRPYYLRDPILISHDGVVWNGNRRLSIVRWLCKNQHETRFEKVPVCKLPKLDGSELKSLEGRLQIKKTHKQEYGTIEIRLRIKQARKRDDWPWEKIQSEFGGKWTVSQLKNMMQEINLVDKYLNRIGKPKDYAYIYNKGGGLNRKGGIEIFVTAAAAEKNLYDDLMSSNGNNQPDPEEYNKRITAWFQQLHLDDVSHDTIREFNAIMNNEQARNEYFEADETYQNFTEYTSTMETVNGRPVEKSFTIPVLKSANENRISTAPTAQNVSKDPKTHVTNALKSLRKVDFQLIPKNNTTFKKTIDDINVIINKITSSENYSVT